MVVYFFEDVNIFVIKKPDADVLAGAFFAGWLLVFYQLAQGIKEISESLIAMVPKKKGNSRQRDCFFKASILIISSEFPSLDFSLNLVVFGDGIEAQYSLSHSPLTKPFVSMNFSPAKKSIDTSSGAAVATPESIASDKNINKNNVFFMENTPLVKNYCF